MTRKNTFRERLKQNILNAQLTDALEHNEYRSEESSHRSHPPDSPADTQADELASRHALSPANSPSGASTDSHTGEQSLYHTDSHSPSRFFYPSGSGKSLSDDFSTTTDPIMCLTDNQAHILRFLYERSVKVIKYDELSQALDIPYGTVRWAIAGLERENFLAKRKFRKGRVQGIAITLNEQLCRDFHRKRIQGEEGETQGNNLHHSNEQTKSQTFSQTLPRTHSRTDTSPPLEKKKEESSFYSRIREFTDEDVAFFYPCLAAIGFGGEQMRQIADRLEQVAKAADKVFVSLEHADWELGQGPLRDKEGEEVASPLGFIFNALARTGYYRKPKGYVTAEEQAARDLEEKAKAARQSRERKERAEFELWRDSLDEEERERLLEGRIGPEEQWLLRQWRKKGKETGELS